MMRSILLFISLTALSVQADPFAPPTKKPTPQAEQPKRIFDLTPTVKPKPKPELVPRLSGIICDTANPMAILDNQLIIKGRMIGHFTVVDITPDIVTLHSTVSNKEYSLTVDTFSNSGTIQVR